MENIKNPHFFRPTQAWIDLAALKHNFCLAQSLLKGCGHLLPIVKANAYGHGAAEVAGALAQAGATGLGVASPEEGYFLRQQGVSLPILILGGPMGASGEFLRQHRLTPCLFESSQIKQLNRELKAPLEVQLKVDTGMGRLGFWPQDLKPVLAELKATQFLKLSGVFSHLASAEDPSCAAVQVQRKNFAALKTLLADFFTELPCFHLANSAALLAGTLSEGDWARPGLMLYGVSPESSLANSQKLKPVMTFKTKVLSLKKVAKGQAVSYGGTWVANRDSQVAVLPVGYADGYVRALSNGGKVWMGGKLCPVVGRVCMDLTLVDVTDCPAVALGDEVELWGKHLPVSQVADKAGTIAYELLCGVSGRVPRVEVGSLS